MTWFRVDDKSHSHPKVIAAGNAAWGLYVRCGAWCADQLTDGKIPKNVAKIFGKPSECRALVAAGLWTENGDFYVIPDYLEFNPSRQRVEGERAAARERMLRRRSGEQDQNKQENIVRSSATPTRPDPITKVTTQLQAGSATGDSSVKHGNNGKQRVAELVAEAYLSQQDRRLIANPAGWVHTVTQSVLRHHGHSIEQALEMGLAVSAIADRIINPANSPDGQAARRNNARRFGIAIAEQQHDNDLVDRGSFLGDIAAWDDDEREAAINGYDTRVAAFNASNVVNMRRSND